jgi:hypothetical protein
MNKLNWKNLLVIGIIATSITGTTQALAADTHGSIEENRFYTRKEYKDMKKSMYHITNDKKRIETLKSKLKADKKNSDATRIHATRKELRKAKADLKRNKTYLKIDKRDWMVDQWAAIHQANVEKRQVKKDLRQAKRTLRKDIRNDNDAAIARDLKRVEELTAKKNEEIADSEALKNDVYEFFVFLDNEIDQVV